MFAPVLALTEFPTWNYDEIYSTTSEVTSAALDRHIT
jgi:hypothetical protein